MKKLLKLAISMALAATAFTATSFAGPIDISTGVANWQVLVPGALNSVAATTLATAQQNGTWAPAPTGSAWVSYGSAQGTSCVIGQTPGNGCANTVSNPNGDAFIYSLVISAATLGTTSGNLNFIFGADNRVNLLVGLGGTSQLWNTGSLTNGNGFNPLGCSNSAGPTSAGNSPATYNNCLGTVSFSAANLNVDGSLTLSATVNNDAIPSCPQCGDPTGFVLEGSVLPNGVAAVPESSTINLVGLAGLAILALHRKLRSSPKCGDAAELPEPA